MWASIDGGVGGVAWKLYERGIHLELVDMDMDPNEYDAEKVKKIIEIALLCTQASAASRPTMSTQKQELT
ncbi:Putative cysteine-rich receptor-like protein kinase 16 [Glycine soja]|uniref:Putative cysteine-rich receptor-like protein kinase 16 n=1 Tax=Glycine soja TaxID=3848 RepID=A0A0B2QVG3_GLYSO|nr:Putative cysteine-rich receptor-like protein kinase 16 [Glycine soja]